VKKQLLVINIWRAYILKNIMEKQDCLTNIINKCQKQESNTDGKTIYQEMVKELETPSIKNLEKYLIKKKEEIETTQNCGCKIVIQKGGGLIFTLILLVVILVIIKCNPESIQGASFGSIL